MNEPELLMRGAIEELMNRTTGERHGRHAVINFHQVCFFCVNFLVR